MDGIKSGISDALCRYAVELRFETIPADVIERTKQSFLDFLGVALGGHEVGESTGPVTAGIMELASSARGRSSVLGEEASFPPHYAALLNGVYAHSMDFDDTQRFGSKVNLVCRDGRRFERFCAVPLGEPENPMIAAAYVQKFRDLAEPVLGRERAGEVLRLVSTIEDVDSLRALGPHLRPLRHMLRQAASA